MRKIKERKHILSKNCWCKPTVENPYLEQEVKRISLKVLSEVKKADMRSNIKDLHITCPKCKEDKFYRSFGGDYTFKCVDCGYKIGKSERKELKNKIEKLMKKPTQKVSEQGCSYLVLTEKEYGFNDALEKVLQIL